MTGRQIYTTTDVFTPNNHAQVNFVPRPSLENALTDALRTPGKQVVIFGHSGSGKSSLLQRKLSQLYPNHITVQCQRSLSWDQILLNAFDQLDRYYMSSSDSSTTRSADASIEAAYGSIKAAIGKHTSQHQQLTISRVVPPQLSAQRLAQFIGEKDLCLVLEDFHKVADTERVHLSQSLKVFVDMAGTYPNVKIICLGAVATARQVVQYDSEMRTRVAEIRVPLMSDNELAQIISNGIHLLNVQLESGLQSETVRFSAGLASVCHQIALNTCWAADVDHTCDTTVTITHDHFNHAIKQHIEESSDSLRSSFDKALRRHRTRKYDNTRLILTAMAHADEDGLTHGDLLQKIRATQPDYPASNLTKYARELQRESRGKLLRHDSDSGQYSFADPLFHAFARLKFAPNPDSLFDEADWKGQIFQLFVEVFSKDKATSSKLGVRNQSSANDND